MTDDFDRLEFDRNLAAIVVGLIMDTAESLEGDVPGGFEERAIRVIEAHLLGCCSSYMSILKVKCDEISTDEVIGGGRRLFDHVLGDFMKHGDAIKENHLRRN